MNVNFFYLGAVAAITWRRQKIISHVLDTSIINTFSVLWTKKIFQIAYEIYF